MQCPPHLSASGQTVPKSLELEVEIIEGIGESLGVGRQFAESRGLKRWRKFLWKESSSAKRLQSRQGSQSSLLDSRFGIGP